MRSAARPKAKPWKDYRPIFLTDKRIDDGIAFYRDHRALLERHRQAIRRGAAIHRGDRRRGNRLWRNTGKYRVLDALVTLGLYYPPRARFSANS